MWSVMDPATTSSFDQAVATVLAGDADAYRVVVEATEARLRVIAAAILPARELVDDAVQEAYVIAYRKLAEYRPGSDFIAWLGAIVRNVALNERRRWLRHEHLKSDLRHRVEQALDERVAAASGRGGAGAAHEALSECIGRLTGAAREVVEEHYWDGASADQIAKARERPSGWTHVVLFRARAALAACLREKGVMHG
jgi:RNA polymerase sigma-70 factor, ECF subfamily